MWQNCQRGAQPFTVSSRGASKCRVISVSTPSPTSAAGRTTVMAMPGWVRGERCARCSISSRSPTTLPSGSSAQRRVLGQRHRVVRAGPVHHRAGDQDHPANPAGRRRGQHGLRAAHVERAPGPVVGVRRQVHVGVHQHVHAGQPARQRRVADVDHPPGDADDVTPVVVDGDHPADRRRRGQPERQRMAEPAGRAGDRDDRAAPGGLGPPRPPGRQARPAARPAARRAARPAAGAPRSAPRASRLPARLPRPVRGSRLGALAANLGLCSAQRVPLPG